MEIAVSDPGIDFMFTMMTPLPSERPEDPTYIEARMRIVGEIVKSSPVPVFLASNTCLDIAPYPRGLLAGNDLCLLPGVDLAMTSIGHMLRWIGRRDALLARPVRPVLPRTRPVDAPLGAWAEDEGRRLLEDSGVPVVPARLVTSPTQAADAAAHFGVPVAMKICSRQVAHKSDVGGVLLNVSGAEAAAAAYQRIVSAVRENVPGAKVRGVLVSPMRGPGHELLVGVTADPVFGPVLAVGLGGIWVEILKDTSLRVLPVDASDVRGMLEDLQGLPLLKGARGGETVDLDALSEVILGISAVAASLGDSLDTLEVNPLRVSAGRIEALDVLVTTSDPENRR
jgi:acyl-CoA synthetase (NDP forming)